MNLRRLRGGSASRSAGLALFAALFRPGLDARLSFVAVRSFMMHFAGTTGASPGLHLRPSFIQRWIQRPTANRSLRHSEAAFQKALQHEGPKMRH